MVSFSLKDLLNDSRFDLIHAHLYSVATHLPDKFIEEHLSQKDAEKKIMVVKEFRLIKNKYENLRKYGMWLQCAITLHYRLKITTNNVFVLKPTIHQLDLYENINEYLIDKYESEKHSYRTYNPQHN